MPDMTLFVHIAALTASLMLSAAKITHFWVLQPRLASGPSLKKVTHTSAATAKHGMATSLPPWTAPMSSAASLTISSLSISLPPTAQSMCHPLPSSSPPHSNRVGPTSTSTTCRQLRLASLSSLAKVTTFRPTTSTSEEAGISESKLMYPTAITPSLSRPSKSIKWS